MNVQFNTTPGGLHIVISALRARIAHIREVAAHEDAKLMISDYAGAISKLEGVMFQLEEAQEDHLQAQAVALQFGFQLEQAQEETLKGNSQ